MEGSGSAPERMPFGMSEQATGQIGARTPPHNFEAEMALLGAILANNRAYDAVSEFLLADHFADRRHGRIYEACARLIDNGLIADPVTLKNLFEQDGALEEIGGAGYLARLAASVVTIINAKDYGSTIYDRFLRRSLINIGSDTANRAYDMTLDYDAKMQIEIAETELYNLAMSGDYERVFKDFGQALTEAVRSAEAAFKREGNLAGIATHLIDVDKLLGGLHTSDLLILAGRPSMGKTALATNIAFNAAKAFRMETDEAGQDKVVDGAVVAFFSLEMSAEELATRILAEQSGISSHKIRRGEISHDEFPRLAQVAQELNRLPLYIDDTAGLTVSALRTRARRLQRQKKMSLIIVDYLQLLRPSMGTRPENRVQELSEITRSLKNLAKDLKVPIVALSQLSRQVENRDDKRPQLADLRESGSIEQDADVVMFVYREEYYLARTEPPEGTEKHTEWQVNMDRVHNMAELIIGKQRHGPIGTVKLYFDPTLTKFDNLAAPDYQSGYGD